MTLTNKELDLRQALGNRSCVIFGNTGTYKTTQLGFIARWIYQYTTAKYGKGRTSRLISMDEGGLDALRPYIDAGIIDAYTYKGSGEGTAPTLKRLSEGYWPDPTKDLSQTYKDWLPLDKSNPPGAYLNDGITAMCDNLMAGLNETGPVLGQAASFKYTAKSDDGDVYVTHGSSQTYYLHVQNMCLAFMKAFNRLPVERIVWTALEAEGTDEISKADVLGPAAKGRALTGIIPSRVGECIHLESYVKEEVKLEGAAHKQKIMGVRAWFEPHPQARSGKIYHCKARVPSDMVPKLKQRFPKGYVELEVAQGVEQLFQFEMELIEESLNSVKNWKESIDNAAKSV